ncbi:NYN domain-containing protein [Streptomyces sp. NPDC001858]
MTVPVIIDASNVAATSQTPWPFSRVVEVREAWLRRHPGADVIAVLDATVRPHLDDQKLVEQAERARWLQVYQGDADDRILALADQYDAAIVSDDNFRYARREHAWLQGNSSRVFSVRRMRGEVILSLRHLGVATDQEIERDRLKKLRKAGLLHPDSEKRFRHASGGSGCVHADDELRPRHVHKQGTRWYCRLCYFDVTETVAEAPLTPGPGAGPVRVTVLHGHRTRESLAVPPEGMTLGRPSRGRPEVTVVTTGLDEQQVRQISRAHVRIFLDDDGKPLVEHIPDPCQNASFLNPELDFRGRPQSSRLATGTPYALEDGDELCLGPGTVRLRIGFGSDE